METHPENLVDLRLDCPWPELLQYCLNHDFLAMDSLQLSHTSYVVILIKCLDIWKQEVLNYI